MPLGRLGTLVLAVTLAIGAAPAQGAAAVPAPTLLSVQAEPRYADLETPVVVTLVQQQDDAPVAAAEVLLERRVNGSWTTVKTLVTDSVGRARVDQTVARDAEDNVFRATYDGDELHEAARSGRYRAPMKRREGVVSVGGPDRVVDEQAVQIRVRWRTRTGIAVPGRVQLWRRNGSDAWKKFRRVRTGGDGVASVEVTPRQDTRWRATAPGLDWVSGDRSRVHRIDNLPPGKRVRLPARAPRPRVRLPRQDRATGEEANPTVTRIPRRIWRQMTGRSWHRGCPVGRGGLRLLRINYWGYDGYRYRGELVARADAVDNMRGALVAMYASGLPIRSMYRVDRFGWSKRVQGADDYKSMAAGNTSAFNCRDVVGRPGVRSPHSYGRSLDLNTWENPYRSSHGWVPNAWWPSRSHARVAWRSREHAVVQIMLAHGFRWTYGTGDAQHFDVPAGNGRVIVPRACGTTVCH
ncbi:M15 family metallopeptidase [Nocardioides sp.]|uniref:M15 family metallopeptidase n=1 Tax=Nocardioides sp. TaxID=35761 RepID=UPI002ED534E6